MVAARPPLPPAAPCLVVGLARSGVAAALALRARGVRRRSACDAGAPAVDASATRGVDARATDAPATLDARARRSSRRPACPHEAPVDRRGARARACRCSASSSSRWRLLPNEFIAVTGHQRQDDDDRADRPHPPRGRAAGRGRRQRRHGADLARRRARRPTATVVCEASSFQLEDTIAFAPEARRAAQPRARPPRPPRHASRPTARPSCAIFAHQGNDDIAVAPLGLGDRGPRRLRAARVRSATGRQAELSDRAGQLWWDERAAASASTSSRLRGAHNRAQRDGRRRGLPGARHRPRRRARRRCGRSPASRTASRRSRRSTASLYVNDSKATNVASTLVALARVRRAGPPDPRRPGQGPGLRAAARAGGRALRRRLPDRRGRAERARRGASARRRAAATLERARRPRRAPPRGPATSCCSRRPARASTSSTTSRRAAGTSRSSWPARRSV